MGSGKKLLLWGILLLCGTGLFAAERNAKEINLCLQWRPQAQFAGFYMAKELGFYQEAGADVRLAHLPMHGNCSDLLLSGKADIVTDWLTGVIGRSGQTCSIVSIGQLMKRAGLILVGSKARGVESLQDLSGRKIGIWGSDFKIAPMAMLKEQGIDYELIPLSGDTDLFLWGGCDAVSVMIYNEYFALLNAGLEPEELSIFDLEDYGFQLPGDGIYARREFFFENRDLCRKLVAATRRGWVEAFANPDKALALVKEECTQAKVPFNEAQQKWMLSQLKALYFPKDAEATDRLSETQFRFTVELLKNNGYLNAGVPDYEEFVPAEASTEEKGEQR